jgi:hypothetical protein
MSRCTLTCPHCGSAVTLPVRRLVVQVDSDATHGVVLFTCLMCHHSAVVALDAAAVSLLIAAGATYVSLDVADQVGRPESAPDGPPLTHDDLLDLHVALSDDHWFDRFPVPEPERP